jgi:hypothetical protein
VRCEIVSCPCQTDESDALQRLEDCQISPCSRRQATKVVDDVSILELNSPLDLTERPALAFIQIAGARIDSALVKHRFRRNKRRCPSGRSCARLERDPFPQPVSRSVTGNDRIPLACDVSLFEKPLGRFVAELEELTADSVLAALEVEQFEEVRSCVCNVFAV